MRICFFGESYVNGTGDPTYRGWVGRLCELSHSRGPDITAYNCGIRGATSDLVRATWEAEAKARLTDIDGTGVIFSFGTNDSWLENGAPRVPFDRHIANTRAILETALTKYCVLFVGPPGLPAYAADTLREADHRERCAGVAKLCDELQVPYFDTLAVYPSFHRWQAEAAASDGAHPGSGGYAEMAAALDAWPAWHAWLAPTS